jgi:hypothetical protein
MYQKLFIGLLCLLPMAAEARPVSYPSGWTVMSMNDMDKNAVHVHYSPTFKYSVGYKGEYWREDEWSFHGVQVNYLLNRWNKRASQANMYLKGALGAALGDTKSQSEKAEGAGFVAFAVDWEDRRYFTSYESRLTYAGDIDQFFMQKARVGITPYIGDYGDIHTWLMLQVEHNPKQNDPIKFTPLVRFFKDVHLLEIGASEDGDVMFNWVVRF